MQPLAAEIIAIGDEVSNGEIVTSNAAHIAARLSEAGWRVVRHTVVGDAADAILAAFAEAESRARVVIVSGGLGPTRDDITSECAAGFRMSRGDRHFFFVPGVPREMKRMLDREILPFLEELLPPGAHRATVLLRTFGMGESRLDERLGGLPGGGAGGPNG